MILERVTRASTRSATAKSRAAAKDVWKDSRAYAISDEEDGVYGRPSVSAKKLKKRRKDASTCVMPFGTSKEIIRQSAVQIRLPYDVLRLILEVLDPISLARCAQVCREWTEILENDTIWRSSREYCFTARVSLPEYLTERDFAEICAATRCSLCQTHDSGTIRSYFVFGMAACDSCFKQYTIGEVEARRLMFKEDLPLELLRTVPHENMQGGRAPLWHITHEARYWPADLKTVVEDSLCYYETSEIQAWIRDRASHWSTLYKSMKPLRTFQSLFKTDMQRMHRELCDYKLRAKRIQITILASQIGISKERQNMLKSCNYIARPLSLRPGVYPVPFTDSELRQIAKRLPAELEKTEEELRMQDLTARARRELKSIVSDTISKMSFAYPRMFFRPMDRPIPSPEMIKYYKKEVIEIDYLVLLYTIGAIYSATEYGNEVAIGVVLDNWELIQEMTRLNSVFESHFPHLTCTTCSPPRNMNICSLYFSYWTHTHKQRSMKQITADAPDNTLWQQIKTTVIAKAASATVQDVSELCSLPCTVLSWSEPRDDEDEESDYDSAYDVGVEWL